MCAVCFTGVQAVPVALLAARAIWVKRRGDGSAALRADGSEGRDGTIEPITSLATRGDDRALSRSASN